MNTDNVHSFKLSDWLSSVPYVSKTFTLAPRYFSETGEELTGDSLKAHCILRWEMANLPVGGLAKLPLVPYRNTSLTAAIRKGLH